MAQLLRVITKPKWAREEWMGPEDVPADALNDLRATANKLSVWRTETNGSDLLRSILIAAASCRAHLDKLDYTLLNEDVLEPLGIGCAISDGETPHSVANASAHRDLVYLTVQKVAALAHVMMPLHRERVSERNVGRMLQEALREGAIDRQRLSPKLLEQIENLP